jgi:hypothetical protein
MSKRDFALPWLLASAIAGTMSLVAVFAPPMPATSAAWFFGGIAAYTFVVFHWAPAAYRAHWLRHTFSSVTAEGLNQHLLRDFCGSEDLWDPHRQIEKRRTKLLMVYLAGAAAHLVVPLALAGLVLLMLGKTSLTWVGIVLVGSALLGIAFAFLFWGLDVRTISSAIPSAETHV